MTDTTHECPAPGCDRRVDFDKFSCLSHWVTIDRALRLEAPHQASSVLAVRRDGKYVQVGPATLTGCFTKRSK